MATRMRRTAAVRGGPAALLGLTVTQPPSLRDDFRTVWRSGAVSLRSRLLIPLVGEDIEGEAVIIVFIHFILVVEVNQDQAPRCGLASLELRVLGIAAVNRHPGGIPRNGHRPMDFDGDRSKVADVEVHAAVIARIGAG